MTYVVSLAIVGLLVLSFWQLSGRGMDRWLLSYLIEIPKRRKVHFGERVHLLLCIADHFEPKWGKASSARAMQRVDRWVEEYPKRFGQFRDSDGRPPRHTFFFPLEEYEPEHLDALASLCRAGFGEIEVHLHHDGDTGERLRHSLRQFKTLLADRHGLLGRDRRNGELVYGFIHGNWALNNSRPDGRFCGVNNEIEVLQETGCYADFTLPSAPSPTQTRKINAIYYGSGDPHRSKGHDWGMEVGQGLPPAKGLILIQGPLVLDWTRRKWGIVPRIENSCLQENQPPTMARLNLWLKAHIQVPSRPDWFFVKLHTHGAKESNQKALLGEAMVQFHQALANRAREDTNFHYHYVTAREMYNLVRAAESGWRGTVDEARDFQVVWNSCLTVKRDQVMGAAIS
jgi:hypothetical protein